MGQQGRRDHGVARAEAAVCFLEGDHVGAHFMQHHQDALGIAATVGADPLWML
jgi:hypothetical protein